MERAIVLINVTPGSEDEVASALKNEKSIVEVNQLYGLYDMLVVVEGETDQHVKEFVSEKLRKNKGIISTITMKVIG